jgi:hypothetical protein
MIRMGGDKHAGGKSEEIELQITLTAADAGA